MLKELIKKIPDYKILLSLFCGYLIAFAHPWTVFLGHLFFIPTDYLWIRHYKKINDKTSVTMFCLWMIIMAYGAIKHGLLL